MIDLDPLVEGFPCPVIVVTTESQISLFNDAALALFEGLEVEKPLAHATRNIEFLEAVKEAATTMHKNSVDFTLKKKQRAINVTLIPLEGAEGAKNMVYIYMRDTSEQERLGRMRMHFIANASHELRTPLTVIAGYLEIMHDDDALPEHLQPAIHSASEQSSRMQMIIEDLLTLSRLENAGLSKSNDTLLSVASIINSICNSEAQLIENNTHEITLDVDSSLKLKGVEVDITSVCANLIHNSIRHTPEGTHIHIRWHQIGTDEACFTVKDTGNGIPAEHLPRLTERFYRVDKGRSKEKGGTGLGMAIVQHIVQRHEARLIIDSKIGEGTTFTVCFPAIRVVKA